MQMTRSAEGRRRPDASSARFEAHYAVLRRQERSLHLGAMGSSRAGACPTAWGRGRGWGGAREYLRANGLRKTDKGHIHGPQAKKTAGSAEQVGGCSRGG